MAYIFLITSNYNYRNNIRKILKQMNEKIPKNTKNKCIFMLVTIVIVNYFVVCYTKQTGSKQKQTNKKK